MPTNTLPPWLLDLEAEDLVFIKNFILNSGSLKDIAKIYDVTYPTVRLRLDRLIQKIQINESTSKAPFIDLIKKLAIDDKLDYDTAKLLINQYKKEIEND